MIKPPLLIIVVLIAGPELAQAALQASVGIVTIITTNTTNTTITIITIIITTIISGVVSFRA